MATKTGSEARCPACDWLDVDGRCSNCGHPKASTDTMPLPDDARALLERLAKRVHADTAWAQRHSNPEAWTHTPEYTDCQHPDCALARATVQQEQP